MSHIKSMNSLSVHPLVDEIISSFFNCEFHLKRSITGF